jgi:hypothetical protein|tara:strand:+ start:158 stop:1681 length:1524 start_codon:yes stop_codon:yes gene_type:complete
MGGEARVDPPIKIMIDDKKLKSGPTTYEHWYDLGYTLIPCDGSRAISKGWQSPDFTLTKEEWKSKYLDRSLGLRLDSLVDFDIDNPKVKEFAKLWLGKCDAVFGRDHNPSSHYIWKNVLSPQKFELPSDLTKYVEYAVHGNCLCEIRSSKSKYTIVPGSLHSKDQEYVRWEKYEGFNEYVGDLNKVLRKIALATALSLLYAVKGQRDEYCTAIAGVLINHTDWGDAEINEFIYQIAIISNDDEADNRKNKGTSTRNSKRQFGMPKLAEILECKKQSVVHIFGWIGAEDKALAEVKEIADESIGQIIQYGQNRYKLKVTGKLENKMFEKTIIVDGQTLMNQKAFYDAVISQAQVWIPKMTPKQFEEIMKMKFETRVQSKDWEDDADNNLVFKKYFTSYISRVKAYTNKKELAIYKSPYFNQQKNYLEFNLDHFEDYLHSQKVNLERVDLVLKIQDILQAKKNRGKYLGKSCPAWKINNPELPIEDLVIEGEYIEETGGLIDDFEKDRT